MQIDKYIQDFRDAHKTIIPMATAEVDAGLMFITLFVMPSGRQVYRVTVIDESQSAVVAETIIVTMNEISFLTGETVKSLPIVFNPATGQFDISKYHDPTRFPSKVSYKPRLGSTRPPRTNAMTRFTPFTPTRHIKPIARYEDPISILYVTALECRAGRFFTFTQPYTGTDEIALSFIRSVDDKPFAAGEHFHGHSFAFDPAQRQIKLLDTSTQAATEQLQTSFGKERIASVVSVATSNHNHFLF